MDLAPSLGGALPNFPCRALVFPLHFICFDLFRAPAVDCRDLGEIWRGLILVRSGAV
jgi:hypothetical protein